MNEYGLRWTEAYGRNGQLITKEKIFRDKNARDRFADRVEDRGSFIRFDAWLDPPANATTTTTNA